MALKIKSIDGITNIVVESAASANSVPASGIVGLEDSDSVKIINKDGKVSFSACQGGITYSAGDNIEITDYTISSRDWTPELDEKQDKLEFSYNENSAISAINGSALAGQGGITEQNSWKQWSEDNGSTGEEKSVYIGENNRVEENTYVIGSANIGENSYIIGHDNSAVDPKDPLNTAFNPSIIIGDNNSAVSGAHVIGEKNYGENNPYIIGRTNNAKKESFVIGTNNTAYEGGVTIGNYNSNNGTSYLIGTGNTAYANSKIIGKNCLADYEGIAIGVEATASKGSFALNIKGRCSAEDKSVAIGGSNNASNYGVSIGHNNSAKALGFCFGFQNTATNFGEAFGFNNVVDKYSFAFGSLNYLDGNCFAFGGQNRNNLKVYSQEAREDVYCGWRNVLVGMNNGVSFRGNDYSASMSGNKTFQSEALLIGHENRLNFNENDTPYSYSYDGLMIGKSNGCKNEMVGNHYTYNNTPQGYCITIGKCNGIGSYEAINIGTKNDVVGHSIGFGWDNKTNDAPGAHSILLGSNNSAYSECEYLMSSYNGTLSTAKKAKIVSYTVSRITENDLSTINAGYNNIGELVDACTTLNSTQKANWKKYYIVYTLKYFAEYLTNTNLGLLATAWYFSDETYSEYWNRYIGIMYDGDSSAMEEFIGDLSNSEITALNEETYTIWQNQVYNTVNKYVNTSSITEIIPGYAITADTVVTNSFVAGTNNSAKHYNSYILGSNNYSEFVDSVHYNGDDGFVFAFGLGNYVARNYDMAIGYGSIASGGENIAIGTPQDTNKLASYEEDKLYTKSIGYKNIAVRSIVSGIENIAVNSMVTHSADKDLRNTTDNLFLNACISGYNDIHSNIIANISPGFKRSYYAGEGYPIRLGTANFSFIQNTLMNNEQGAINNSIVFSDRGYDNSDEATITSAKIYRSLVGFGYSPIRNSQIDASIFGFNSTADSATNVGCSIVAKSKVTDLLAESLIIGSNVGNVAGSVIVTDYPRSSSAEGNNIRNTVRSLIIGDNICIGEHLNSPNSNSFIIGEKNSAFNNSFNVRIFGRYNSLDANATKNYTDIFGENNVTYTGTYARVFGNGNMFDGNYNEIFGTYNKIMNKDTSISDFTDWSQFQNNTTPSRKAKANTTETSAILYTKQSLYNNYVYYYQNVDELNTKWQTVKSYVKNFRYMPSTGTIYYDYGILYYPNSSASNIINGFVTKADYQDWISYDSEFYIKDYITYEMYNNLPETAKSQYSYYGTVSGKSLYYRTIDWKNISRTHVFSAMPVVSGNNTTNQGMAYCHFTELEIANLTQVTSDADLYSLGTPNNNDIIYTNANGSVNAKLGIKGVFNASDVLIADNEEPNVWTKYGQYARPNAANHILIRGSDNRCYNTTNVNHTYLFGTSNELLDGYHSYEFIEGCNNRISGYDNSNLTIIGGANIISGTNNYHTMLVGQNNTATSGILAFAFGTDNYTNSACSYAFGEGLRADYNQIVVGKFNEELPNDLYYRFRYKWNSDTQSAEPVPTSGVLFTVGNGYLDNCYEYGVGRDWKIKDLNGNDVGTQILNDTYLKRSNAMIVSADGTVSATRFATSGVADLEAKILELENIISQFSARWVLTNN